MVGDALIQEANQMLEDEQEEEEDGEGVEGGDLGSYENPILVEDDDEVAEDEDSASTE